MNAHINLPRYKFLITRKDVNSATLQGGIFFLLGNFMLTLTKMTDWHPVNNAFLPHVASYPHDRMIIITYVCYEA